MALSFAEVSVNSPAGERQLFCYSIPEGLALSPGHAVWVPFGKRILQGVVVVLSEYPSVESVRPIDSLIQPEPLLSKTQLELSQWISDYYFSPIFAAIALFLPPGFERQPLTFISVTNKASLDDTNLNDEQKQLLNAVRREGTVSLKQLEKVLGKKTAQRVASQLVNRGFITRSYEIEREKVKPKQEDYVRLTTSPAALEQALTTLKKRAPRQVALLEYLTRQKRPIPVSEVKQAGFPRPLLNILVSRNLVSIEPVEVKREPIDYSRITPSSPLKLTPAQSVALSAITQNLKSGKPGVFVLHGVTGSGKTEVYLQALAEARKLGQRGIALVPEIALTPQTIERFASRFPHKVAVLHSKLSLGEQFDQWRDIQKGGYDVVVGPRGAIFAPQPDLGLIVIDEEHEWTYKQQDQSPRYHARNVALKLAEMTEATVILGSATPDVETYYHAKTGDYTLLELPERLTPHPGSPMPNIELVDLREELKSGNRSMFSHSLREAMGQALSQSEQVILFFNRRGSATFVQCRTCGLVVKCRRCQVPMSYHSAEGALVCHQCNRHQPVPTTCPRCFSRRIKFLGIGTQKLEEETAQGFPTARLLRWDSDVTRAKHSHQEIMDKLKSHQADILIGTQMVAKGLDLPQVTLVGVVSADTALNLPDFRAGERTFQLLSQVAGRAGRGERPGHVIIQTYSPEHYAIQAVLKQDYEAFYNQEIAFRRELGEPPFSQLVRLTYVHVNETACKTEAERMKHQLEADIAGRGIIDVSIIGPAPAFIARLRGRYRWQLTLRGNQPERLLNNEEVPSGWAIDVDPVGLN
ncbi:MAG: primosomal protein N' [Dehalococcoidales bacterium]|jgi:primosomal protein N' (replication factor Y)